MHLRSDRVSVSACGGWVGNIFNFELRRARFVQNGDLTVFWFFNTTIILCISSGSPDIRLSLLRVGGWGRKEGRTRTFEKLPSHKIMVIHKDKILLWCWSSSSRLIHISSCVVFTRPKVISTKRSAVPGQETTEFLSKSYKVICRNGYIEWMDESTDR